jgi:hypothetical protein
LQIHRLKAFEFRGRPINGPSSQRELFSRSQQRLTRYSQCLLKTFRGTRRLLRGRKGGPELIKMVPCRSLEFQQPVARVPGKADDLAVSADWPIARPQHWRSHLNNSKSESEVESNRRCVRRGSPYGSKSLTTQSAVRLSLEHTLRSRDRPRLFSDTAAGKRTDEAISLLQDTDKRPQPPFFGRRIHRVAPARQNVIGEERVNIAQ